MFCPSKYETIRNFHVRSVYGGKESIKQAARWKTDAPYWLDYLLRCRKGEYYRKRFPALSLVESEKNDRTNRESNHGKSERLPVDLFRFKIFEYANQSALAASESDRFRNIAAFDQYLKLA